MRLNLSSLTDSELSRELAHARNRRDAYAAGREPFEVTSALRDILSEQDRRRGERALSRYIHEPDVLLRATAPGIAGDLIDVVKVARSCGGANNLKALRVLDAARELLAAYSELHS